MENNIKEISIAEIEQINGAVAEPVTATVIIIGLGVITVGYLAYSAAYNAGRDRAIRDNNLGLNQ